MSFAKRRRRPPILRPLAWLCLPCALALLAPPAARADGDPGSVPAPRATGAAARTARGAAAAARGQVPAPAASSASSAATAADETGLAARMTLDLRQASVATALRLISEVSGHNLVATRAAAERELTLYLVSTSAGEALDAVTRAAGLWVLWRPQSRSHMVMTAEEYQRELTVFGEERTEVLHLRHHNVVAAANSLRAVFGARVRLQTPVEENLGETLKVTDLRRAVSNGSMQAFNPTGARNVAGGALAPGLSLADAQAAGLTRDQRGGSRANAAAGVEGAQFAAAAAAAGATAGQTEAAQLGLEAPVYVTYNRLHNLLIVRTGDPRVLQAITELVGRIDLPARQVLLEMRIIQVRLDDEFHRAFDFDFFSTSAAGGVVTTATGQPLNPLTGSTVSIDPVTGAVTAPRVLGSLGNFNLFDRNSGIFQLLNNRIRLRLQLLEEQGRVETLAKPLLLASNNEPARLFIGEEVVLTTGASAQTTTGTTGATNTVITAETERRNIGTTLVIHPRINDDRTVTLTIDQENSERVAGGTTIPLATGTIGDGVVQYPIDTVNSANVQAVAMAKDGLTIAVGGLIKISKTDSDTAVPGLSAIPLLGELFKSKKRVAQRSELVLVITPHVLDSAEQAQDVTRRINEQASPALSGPAAGQALDSRPPP
ncbi:MAG: hypothetical protein QM750_31900 [Rubrivivax sp.]